MAWCYREWAALDNAKDNAELSNSQHATRYTIC